MSVIGEIEIIQTNYIWLITLKKNFMENCIENHGQNFLHELTELIKIDFSIEYFTTDL